MEKNIICTVCPRGCHMKVTLNGTEVTEVTDYSCKRGKEYAAAEATHPVRILTTTVKIADNQYNLLWVTDFPLFEHDEETDTYHAMHQKAQML